MSCIKFREVEVKRALQKIVYSFFKWFLSRQAHTLRSRRDWTPSDDLSLRVPIGNLALIDLDLPLIALDDIAERRRRKIINCT
jgi:hypothetical protein